MEKTKPEAGFGEDSKARTMGGLHDDDHWWNSAKSKLSHPALQ
jgi:hypothetical protein